MRWVGSPECSILLVNAFKIAKVRKLISSPSWRYDDSWCLFWQNLVHARHSFNDRFVNLVVTFDRIWWCLVSIYIISLRILVGFNSVDYTYYFNLWRICEKFCLFNVIWLAFVEERMSVTMLWLFIRLVEDPNSWGPIRYKSECKTEKARLFI